MSLISQLPLAAISFYCRNIAESKKFYRDMVGLKLIDEKGGSNSNIHFDLGNIRLSLRSREDVKGELKDKSSSSEHLVFLVESSIEAVQADLVKRGVKMRTKKVVEDAFGKSVWFADPDGHIIYLWQPPRRDSKNFSEVENLVRHYESISRALADLREVDE